MNKQVSWIDLELSATFGGWTLPESEPMIDAGLSEADEEAIRIELMRIERIVSERRSALTAQSAAKARAFSVLRSHRMASI